MNLLLKTMSEETRLNVVILEYFICQWERGEVGRWEVSEVVKVGG